VSAEGQTNVINNVHWRLLGTDGIYKGEIYGNLGLPFTADKSFIEYADLTQEQVIDWVKANLGDERIDGLKEAIDVQIDAQANPKTGSGLPWAK
jgi:hypothetical protein